MPIQSVSQALGNEVGGSPFGFKNRLINGGMVIDQRFAGAQQSYVYNANAAAKYCVDRWYCNLFNFSSGTVVYQQQVSDAPPGFSKSLKITAAQNNSGQSFLGGWLQQGIEGYTVADLINASGGLSAVTISFWVKASKTGTLSVCLESTGDAGVSGTNAHYVSPVTINAINTWEYKTVSVPAGTIGSWYKDNNGALAIAFGLCSNGSWLVGTPNQWNNDANRGVLVSNQTNFIANTNDTIQFTGIQLEKGTQATGFDWKPYTTELQLCQRYYYTTLNDTHKVGWHGLGTGNYIMHGMSNFPVSMRATPSVSLFAYMVGAGAEALGDGRNGVCVYNGGLAAYYTHTYGYSVAVSRNGISGVNSGENTTNNTHYAAGYTASSEL